MTEQLQRLLKAANIGGIQSCECYGLDPSGHYDLLVVAPSWKPTIILPPEQFQVECTAVHSYTSGYEVRQGRLRIGWVQTSAGGGSVIDELSVCTALNVDKLVFLGAVGSLVPGFALGDVCTPRLSIDGGMARAYLSDDLRRYRPFETVYPNDPDFVHRVVELAARQGVTIKPATVFCTDSIFGEYAHLEFIKSLGAELIEMETACFYHMAALMEKPAVALLAVSDNSATGDPLLGRTEAHIQPYDLARKAIIPQLLAGIASL